MLFRSAHNLALGLSTGWAGSGLYPTRTQPDLIECGRFRLATNSNEVSNQSSQVVSVFECESVGFRFFDIAEFWPKSSQILSDLV